MRVVPLLLSEPGDLRKLPQLADRILGTWYFDHQNVAEVMMLLRSVVEVLGEGRLVSDSQLYRSAYESGVGIAHRQGVIGLMPCWA
jgi:hypothetical protein